jgi:hypothetical protein
MGRRGCVDAMEKRKILCPFRELKGDVSIDQPETQSVQRLRYHES